jgi:hypothetical protein
MWLAWLDGLAWLALATASTWWRSSSWGGPRATPSSASPSQLRTEWHSSSPSSVAPPTSVRCWRATESITLAQALVYRLLQFSPAALGVATVVCAASLISGNGVADEVLESELAKLAEVGSDALLCRQVILREINLKQLIGAESGQHDL